MATTNASSFSYLSTTGNRFSGLASGMDIDSIVEKLMKAESAKMEKLQQQKQKYEWQRDAYRDTNRKLEAFRTEAFDKYKPSTFLTKTASVSDSSKVSVTAGASASGSLSITDATLATSANKVSGSLTDVSGNPVTGATKLSDLGITDSEVKVNVIQKDGTLKQTTIKFDPANDTLDDFAKKVNSSGAGLTAIVSDGQMSLTANATGHKDGVSMEVVAGSSDIFGKLGLAETDGSINAVGKNAKYFVNGIKKESTSNTINESGYSITLNKEFTGAVSVSSTTDTDSVVNQVKSFVELYNGLIDGLNSSIKEKKNYNFQPLTEAEKSAMSADEIKKWEEKAKEGLLRNDDAISSVVSKMREVIYSISTDKDGEYNALYKIGITTSKEFKDGGKLVIDEKKLKETIEANPEAVADLFSRAEGANGADDKGGLVVQLRSAAKTGVDSIAKKAGKEDSVENTFALGKSLISVESKIKDWQTKLKKIEERYFKQFSAMEAAIQKANSQASIFMQQG